MVQVANPTIKERRSRYSLRSLSVSSVWWATTFSSSRARASSRFGRGWFYLGFALYASTAFGWVFVMRHLKLATISVVYSVSMVLLLTAVGVVVFRESLNHYELAGIVLAVASLVLLMRFA
jgi:drug/metabolite transporter (DMT)-like permease